MKYSVPKKIVCDMTRNTKVQSGEGNEWSSPEVDFSYTFKLRKSKLAQEKQANMGKTN